MERSHCWEPHERFHRPVLDRRSPPRRSFPRRDRQKSLDRNRHAVLTPQLIQLSDKRPSPERLKSIPGTTYATNDSRTAIVRSSQQQTQTAWYLRCTCRERFPGTGELCKSHLACQLSSNTDSNSIGLTMDSKRA